MVSIVNLQFKPAVALYIIYKGAGKFVMKQADSVSRKQSVPRLIMEKMTA